MCLPRKLHLSTLSFVYKLLKSPNMLCWNWYPYAQPWAKIKDTSKFRFFCGLLEKRLCIFFVACSIENNEGKILIFEPLIISSRKQVLCASGSSDALAQTQSVRQQDLNTCFVIAMSIHTGFHSLEALCKKYENKRGLFYKYEILSSP